MRQDFDKIPASDGKIDRMAYQYCREHIYNQQKHAKIGDKNTCRIAETLQLSGALPQDPALEGFVPVAGPQTL